MTGGVYLVAGLVYVIFGSIEVEKWAQGPRKQKQEETEKKAEINSVFSISNSDLSKTDSKRNENHIEKTEL